ncbi:methyl-accepting chemotaxis protein [Paenibacillus sp. 1_12]|uniref:methyl-accepting chemotaxis protein n=1 Tax=Paenibacillus sp. 1_12 TaxID=1566278 RepID=UPI0008F04C39|nr:methyl-accepting chemotaxis protein [Paenibacillus sp. 1_12]SFK99774.1 methyl-accepting chemotaxis protein [Paenibacillus sp. 1_12]
MRFTISNKMITGFIVIALLLGLVSAFSHYYLQKVDDSYLDLVNRRTKILSNSKDMRSSTLQQMSSLRDYLLTQSQDGLNRYTQANANLTEQITATVNMVKRDTDKTDLNKLNTLNQQLKKSADQVATLAVTNKEAAVKLASSETILIGREMETLANQIAENQQKLVDEGSAENSLMVESVKRTVLIISVFSFILAIVIGYLISRIISKPIVFIANAAKQIASGDLTLKEIKVKNRDEVGELADSFNQMVTNLRSLILQVRTSAENVTASSEELTSSAHQTHIAAEQIATAIQEVAAGADKQVQSVTESVHAVNEMSASAQQISIHAQSVSFTTSEAAEKSLEGKQAIQKVIHQMNFIHQTIENLSGIIKGLSDRSQDIEEIVEIITGIAARTNILALNASIEAARAGEQGKGFAVVASEIRKLAEQSSHSSQQIANLISTIQQETHQAAQSMEAGSKEVNEGMLVVHIAGTSFEHIEQSVLKVVTQIQEVSAAAEQMSASTEQVGNSMNYISKIVEESTTEIRHVSASTEEQLASMEEVFSSASSMTEMSEQLQNQIVRFTL